MQDNASSTDLELLKLLLAGLPRPDRSAALSAADQRRLEACRADELAVFLSEFGTGPVAKGKALILPPTALDPVLSALGLSRDDDPALALCTSCLGVATAMTRSGRIIGIDPMTSAVTLVPGPAPSAVEFQIIAVQEILALIGELSDPNAPIDLEGKRLDRVLSTRLGPLDPGEVYAMGLGYDDPRAFDASTWTKRPLAEALLNSHRAEAFEIVDLGS